MSAVLENIQGGTASNTDLVLTKPTGLAVGDLMVAVVFYNADTTRTSGAGVATPAGWSQELREFTNATGAPDDELVVLTKTADSSDVAASNFTFTNKVAEVTYVLLGNLARISGDAFLFDSSGNSDTASTTSLATAGITPGQASSLLLGIGATSDAGTIGVSSFALATSDPTWTPQTQQTQTDANRDSALRLFSATRLETTATGDATATYAGTVNGSSYAALLSISQVINGTFTAPDTKINAYAFTPITETGLDAVVEDVTTNSYRPTQWITEPKA